MPASSRFPVDPLPVTRRRPVRMWPWSFILAPVIAAFLLRPHDESPPSAAAQPTTAAEAGARNATAAAVEQPMPLPPDARTEAPALPSPATTFAEYVEQLVALGLETSRLAAAGDAAAAHSSDAAAQRTFAAMMEHLPDAEAEALAALLDTPPPADSTAAAEHLRRRVWHLAFGTGLQRRHANALAGGAHEPLDSLVAATLTALPGDAEMPGEVGQAHLVDRPYLGSVHEAAVLDLAALSGEGRFPPAVATALLTTLWRNLQATGQRSSDELASLALVLLADENPSKRISACRQLIGDERFRLLVLDHVARSKDAALARELAMAAAQDLPPAAAMSVLAATAAVGRDFQAPFLVLGLRDAALLQREYERRLADDVDPHLRAQLVGGAGFARSPQGIELAQLAFASDPDAEVRLKALFVLTANAADALGERTMAAALDDPRLRDDPRRLDAIVLALENLERAGLVNAVDRLGQRLRGCAALSPASRDDLERLLARALPGGQTSTNQTSR